MWVCSARCCCGAWSPGYEQCLSPPSICPSYIGFVIFFIVLFLFTSSPWRRLPQTELLSTPPEYLTTLTLDNYRRMADQLPFNGHLTNSLIFAVGSSVLAVNFVPAAMPSPG